MTNTLLDQRADRVEAVRETRPHGIGSWIIVLSTVVAIGVLLTVSLLQRTPSSGEDGSSAQIMESRGGTLGNSGSAETAHIVMRGSTVRSVGDGVAIESHTATILNSGTYLVSGTLVGGQLVVAAQEDADVRLVLHQASIASEAGPAIAVISAGSVTVELVSGTENFLSAWDSGAPGRTHSGVLHSTVDLKVVGQGSLVVMGGQGDGIVGESGVIVATGTIHVETAGDAVIASDYIVTGSPSVTVVAGGYGFRSGDAPNSATAVSDPSYVSIAGGEYSIQAGNDAIYAADEVFIYGGQFDIHSDQPSTRGEESNGPVGIGGQTVVITGGTLNSTTN